MDGAGLRAQRLAAGVTLRQMARLVGVSATHLSYAERNMGQRPVTPALVARYAKALADTNDQGDVEQTSAAGQRESAAMQRRRVIAGLAASAVVLPALRSHTAALIAGLDSALYAPAAAAVAPVGLDRLHVIVAAMEADFAAVRLRELAATAPFMIQTAVVSREHAPAHARAGFDAALAASYGLGNQLAIKLHAHDLAWVLAERGAAAAHTCGDPATIARAQWRLSVSLRRSRHLDAAAQVITSGAQRLADDTGLRQTSDVRFYLRMVCCAAYTAAHRDRPHEAYGLLAHARDTLAAHRGVSSGAHRVAASITGYHISVARVLGDFGAAADLAATLHAGVFPTPERQVRYLEDTAIAMWGAGRPADTFQALLAAQRVAPQEMRRPWAQRLAVNLRSARPQVGLSGVREFATRIGL